MKKRGIEIEQDQTAGKMRPVRERNPTPNCLPGEEH